MNLKRGNIVKGKSKDDNLFLVLKVIYDKEQIVAVKIRINKRIGTKFVLKIIDGNNNLFIRYDVLSLLAMEHIEKYNYDLLDPYGVVSQVYDIREKNLEKIKYELKEQSKRRIKARKASKRQRKTMLKEIQNSRNKSKGYPPKMAGMHDSIYKGYIKIVRG